MMDNLYNAGNSTAGALSLLDQTALNIECRASMRLAFFRVCKNSGSRSIACGGSLCTRHPDAELAECIEPVGSDRGSGRPAQGHPRMSGSYTQPLSQTAQQWTGAVKNIWPTGPLERFRDIPNADI